MYKENIKNYKLLKTKKGCNPGSHPAAAWSFVVEEEVQIYNQRCTARGRLNRIPKPPYSEG